MMELCEVVVLLVRLSQKVSTPSHTEPTGKCQLHKSHHKEKGFLKVEASSHHHIIELKAKKTFTPFTLGVRRNKPMRKYCICYIFSLFSKVFNLTFHLARVCIFSPFGNVATDNWQPWQPASSSAHLPKRETLGALGFLGHQDCRRWIGSGSKVPGATERVWAGSHKTNGGR